MSSAKSCSYVHYILLYGSSVKEYSFTPLLKKEFFKWRWAIHQKKMGKIGSYEEWATQWLSVEFYTQLSIKGSQVYINFENKRAFFWIWEPNAIWLEKKQNNNKKTDNKNKTMNTLISPTDRTKWQYVLLNATLVQRFLYKSISSPPPQRLWVTGLTLYRYRTIHFLVTYHNAHSVHVCAHYTV